MTAPAAAPEIKRAAAALSSVDADGTFVGYASLFGAVDLARDVVEPGAFAASLARRGASGVKMLWHHDPAEPIGRWLEIREDARGLKVRGRLLTEVARAREALALMRAGVLDGLSIGFRTVKGRAEPKAGVRRLIEIDLWEISLVTFPMLPAARVSAVKTAPAARRPEPPLADRIRRAAALLEPRTPRGLHDR
ncbi:HK97 family phage prohead protease [Prosthecomicrobium sp. N25]|uniref:HK97 family phage prohead protease n=1 Tax=Prosthecomicrobium sp. N25 TaxID=3129254 RepID=UPI0030782F49